MSKTNKKKEGCDSTYNPLDGLAGYQLRRASVMTQADLAARLAEFELKVTEASILVLIGANPGITQSQLGRVLGIQRANMAPLTAGLLSRDMIKRQNAGGRGQALQLTPEGRSVASECLSRFKSHDAGLLAPFSAVERERLIRNLRTIWEDQAGWPT